MGFDKSERIEQLVIKLKARVYDEDERNIVMEMAQVMPLVADVAEAVLTIGILKQSYSTRTNIDEFKWSMEQIGNCKIAPKKSMAQVK